LRIVIKKVYFKRSRKGQSPITYEAIQSGVGKTVHAVIKIDPILKKHKLLEKSMLQHEHDEINHWGLGKKGNAHYSAKSKESKLTKNLSVNGFWQKVE
jgi:hypothetical protein